ncbi:Uncharacterised protein [Vibrio cholerae]|uniref:Uncharacterized protein n=1 Tax=Vibrio cholerae TaxID=666 RepID=A0A655ZF03_VIBCL|nr:Uncharacterised protein [Vibrio cholerae]CSA94247.1 Uncharacterised protein [Vibrio cholerae]CSA94494.1 Uncharacterised protein [Vibrio cholerae]CSA96230.1 Uncharacterised protein [Vibrio cholerae]CSB78283.1 Uncharacterised protein [Vibrio cholerae]
MFFKANITPIIDVLKFNFGATRAVQNDFLNLFAQLIEGRVYIKIVVLGQCSQHLEIIKVLLIPTADRTLCQT